MNLDELQSVQARERQSSDLQHLRSSFYREVGEYIQGLTEERARVVESADDPFSSPEVRQLTNDIETAEQTVEAIYERRVGKVVKKASIAAAGMPVDVEGLTDEEEALFEDLVVRIEDNRENVLSVLDGEAPSVSCSVDTEATDEPDQTVSADTSPATGSDQSPDSTADRSPTPDMDSTPETDGVNAADLMGGGQDEEDETSTADDGTIDPEADALTASDSDSPPEPPADMTPADDASTDRTAVPPEQGPPGSEGAEESSTVDSADEPAPESGKAAASADEGEAAPSADDEAAPSADEKPAPTSSERDIPGIPRTTVRITDDVGEMVGADNRDYELGSEDVVKLPEPNADVLVDKGAAERLD